MGTKPLVTVSVILAPVEHVEHVEHVPESTDNQDMGTPVYDCLHSARKS